MKNEGKILATFQYHYNILKLSQAKSFLEIILKANYPPACDLVDPHSMSPDKTRSLSCESNDLDVEYRRLTNAKKKFTVTPNPKLLF